MGDEIRTSGGADEVARDRLLRSALDLFDRKGYAGTTVREIVEAAGVTKPALYYYFRNKEGLYLALMGDSFAAFQKMLADAGNRSGGTRELILSLCDEVYTFTRKHLALIRLMYAIYYGPPQGAPPFDFDAVHREFQAIVLSLLREGMRAGELRPLPPEEAMWAVIGAINIALEIELCHPELSLGREGLARVIHLAFDGLAAKGPPAHGGLS